MALTCEEKEADGQHMEAIIGKQLVHTHVVRTLASGSRKIKVSPPPPLPPRPGAQMAQTPTPPVTPKTELYLSSQMRPATAGWIQPLLRVQDDLQT